MSVKMVLKMSGFYLGKARAGVLSLSQPLSLSTTPKPRPHTPTTTLQPLLPAIQRHCIHQPCYYLYTLPHHTPHNNLEAFKHCDRQDFNT